MKMMNMPAPVARPANWLAQWNNKRLLQNLMCSLMVKRKSN
jgi:hypothetical protein